jgi:PAS domain S-box-containing protein
MKRARILIVEDDPVIRLSVQSQLENLGYEVCGAVSTCAEAVETARNASPDLVLMDVKLEGEEDGIEAAMRIRGESDVPIVYASAFSDDPLVERAKASEPSGWILKPYGERALLTVLETALHKHRGDSRIKRNEARFRRELAERERGLERETKRRHSAEDALKRGEQLYRAVFESAQECIFVKDTAGRYIQVNPFMARLVGKTEAELLGQTDESLFGEAASHIREVEARTLRGETVQEEHTRTLNGEPLTFYDVRTPLIDGKGNIVGIIGVSRDITEYRAASRKGSPGHVLPFRAKATKKVLERALLAARRDCAALLLGESGSGKDWLAKFIHDHSARSAGPFFSINCAAISAGVAESELFGHERGAFTGAFRRKRGLLELAEGGTLLLNEIGDMSPELQSKLLSFLDTMRFSRLGGENVIRVNARLLAATNKNLETEVEDGRFRKDLYYRLSVFPITVPPLRERIEDIPVLVEELLDLLVVDRNIRLTTFLEPAALEAFCTYQWPGNVRELRNVLERAVILSGGGPIGLEALQIEKKHLGHWLWTTSFPPLPPSTKWWLPSNAPSSPRRSDAPVTNASRRPPCSA